MRISSTQLVTFTKHLHILLKSGITISDALATLSDRSAKTNLGKVINQVQADIKEGSSLHKSLSKFPKIFSQFYLGMVMVGESSGNLENSLEYLSLQLTREYSLRRKVQGALMYPSLVLSASIFLGGFISLYILPKLVDFFTAFESQLPMSTVILLKFALFMKNWGVLFFFSLFAFFVIFLILIKFKPIKIIWHRLLLRFPLVGQLLREAELSRFSRSLGILIKSGVPLSQALTITGNSLSNLSYQSAVLYLNQHLQDGKKIAQTLNNLDHSLFPRLITDMIAVGEKTGKIEDSLLYVSQFYDDDIDEVTKNLSNILEPALLLFIGLMVGFLALAIIGPIYQLTGVIGQ